MLEMFHCEPQAMRLTARGCARLWESANDPQNPPRPWEARAKCANCVIGAGHAGKTVAPMAAMLAEIKRICPRCTKFSDRIVNTRDGHRLCVSCANRHYEAFRPRADGGIGCDAKGHRPRLADILHSQEVVAIGPAGTRMIKAARIKNMPELLISAASTAEVFIGIGRPRVVWGFPARPQSDLPFDVLSRPRRRRRRPSALPLMQASVLASWRDLSSLQPALPL